MGVGTAEVVVEPAQAGSAISEPAGNGIANMAAVGEQGVRESSGQTGGGDELAAADTRTYRSEHGQLPAGLKSVVDALRGLRGGHLRAGFQLVQVRLAVVGDLGKVAQGQAALRAELMHPARKRWFSHSCHPR